MPARFMEPLASLPVLNVYKLAGGTSEANDVMDCVIRRQLGVEAGDLFITVVEAGAFGSSASSLSSFGGLAPRMLKIVSYGSHAHI